MDDAFGGLGRVLVHRYHPDCSSSHPVLQVCFRCNFDVQCTDRVFVCSARREVFRKRRVRKSAAAGEEDIFRPTEAKDPHLNPTVPAPHILPGALDPDRQQSVASEAAQVSFRLEFRRPLLGGAGFDLDEDEADFMPGDEQDPNDELLLNAAEPPCPDDFFEEEYVAPPQKKPGDMSAEDRETHQAAVAPSAAAGPGPFDDGPEGIRMQAITHDGNGVFDEHADLFPHGLENEELDDVGDVPRVQLRIHRHWSDLIAAGRKKVEARVNVGRAATVNEGDILVLNDVQCKVVRRRTHKNFRAMLLSQAHVGNVTPGLGVEEALQLYHSFANYEKLAAEHGVVSFEVELTAEQPAWRGDTPVVIETKEVEEYNVAPEKEHLIDWDHQRPWWQTAYEAFKHAYRAMSNIAHYQTDYATKSNPMMGNELSEQCVGVERLRKEEIRDGVRKFSTKELIEAGRKTLIRLQTSANRAALKKLPEMVFQMLFKHECYQSHQPWTIFCRGVMWDAFCASHWQKLATRRMQQEQWRPGVAWSAEKAELMEEVRQVEGDYAGLEPDDAEHTLREQEGIGHVRVTGPGRRPVRSASVNDPDGENPNDDEHVDGALSAHIAPDRSMKQDWLYRGDRQPLASMGLYHYAMFVYTTHLSANSIPADDFFTYCFSDGHPDAARRVQKLRVHDFYKVPKVMGFTMPREDGASADLFRNTMFKSVLFRPIHPKEGSSRRDEMAAAMLAWVDATGAYSVEWKRWWDNQCELAQRFEFLQQKCLRVFTLADVHCNIGYMEPVGDRTMPSAAEFMAHITVEAATHFEIGAQSRSGRTVCPEFDAGDFGSGGGLNQGGGFVGGDAEENDAGPIPISKQTEPLFAVGSLDARSVALAEEIAPDPRSLKYFKEFDEAMAQDLAAAIEGGHERVSDESGAFAWPSAHTSSQEEFRQQMAKQKAGFTLM